MKILGLKISCYCYYNINTNNIIWGGIHCTLIAWLEGGVWSQGVWLTVKRFLQAQMMPIVSCNEQRISINKLSATSKANHLFCLSADNTTSLSQGLGTWSDPVTILDTGSSLSSPAPFTPASLTVTGLPLMTPFFNSCPTPLRPTGPFLLASWTRPGEALRARREFNICRTNETCETEPGPANRWEIPAPGVWCPFNFPRGVYGLTPFPVLYAVPPSVPSFGEYIWSSTLGFWRDMWYSPTRLWWPFKGGVADGDPVWFTLTRGLLGEGVLTEL